MASSILFPFLFLIPLAAAAAAESAKTYIVYMNGAHKSPSHRTHAEWHRAHLKSLSIDPDRHLVYSYSSALHGFAATLSPSHLPLLRRHPSVLHLHPDPLLPLLTTRSPLFLGLLPSPSPYPHRHDDVTLGDVIVGVLDTGVWPESPSFSDSGLPPVPARWRGECEAGVDFPPSLCNRKLVGARSFSRGFRANSDSDSPHEFASPRDRDGHGTHTASTAAGHYKKLQFLRHTKNVTIYTIVS